MPEFDTEDWRTERNRMLMQWIGDADAVRFLLDYFDACELFDDLIDKDKPIEDEHAVRVLFNLLTELPLNPFFDRFKENLIPMIVTGINAWLDANDLESGNDNQKAFAYVLRDIYCELIAFVIYLTRGRDYMREHSMEIRLFFTHHETLEQYREKLA